MESELAGGGTETAEGDLIPYLSYAAHGIWLAG